MKKFDVSKVDLKLLMIFQAVFEEESVTAASTRLNLSQPLISHALDRLRQAFSDPLFVRAGRNITPTERARDLAPAIAGIIEQLIRLAEPERLDSQSLNTMFCLSANDYERRLLAPSILKTLLEKAPNASLRMINTSGDFQDALRTRKCDVLISPVNPPDLLDFYSEPLFSDKLVCFFDGSMVSAKEIGTAYTELNHAIVQFHDTHKTRVDELLKAMGKQRRLKLIAPDFETLPQLIKGTRIIATLPSLLANSLFHGFAQADLPFEHPLLEFKMVWHKSTHDSAQYQWFRSIIRGAFNEQSADSSRE